MENGYIYVLRCNDLRYYIGSTRDLDKRIEAHQQGRVRTTKGRRPVQLIYTEEFETYSAARSREIFLKSGTGRDWLKMKLESLQSG